MLDARNFPEPSTRCICFRPNGPLGSSAINSVVIVEVLNELSGCCSFYGYCNFSSSSVLLFSRFLVVVVVVVLIIFTKKLNYYVIV